MISVNVAGVKDAPGGEHSRASCNKWRNLVSCTDKLNGTMKLKNRSAHSRAATSRDVENEAMLATSFLSRLYRSIVVGSPERYKGCVAGDSDKIVPDWTVGEWKDWEAEDGDIESKLWCCSLPFFRTLALGRLGLPFGPRFPGGIMKVQAWLAPRHPVQEWSIESHFGQCLNQSSQSTLAKNSIGSLLSLFSSGSGRRLCRDKDLALAHVATCLNRSSNCIQYNSLQVVR